MSQKQNELVEELVEELGALKEKNESLEHGVSNLREVVAGEQERVVRMLERDLAENRKHIRMLNSEAKDLDQILSMGQPAKVNWGLRYQGSESTGEVQHKGDITLRAREHIKRWSQRSSSGSTSGRTTRNTT